MRPLSVVEVAARRAADPGRPLWKPLGEFLDAFYEATQDVRPLMLSQAPQALIPFAEAAYLAAAAEHLSRLYGLEPPAWVEDPAYVLDRPFWPDGGGRIARTLHLAESPTAFRRRLIFTEARPLRRKGGPLGVTPPGVTPPGRSPPA